MKCWWVTCDGLASHLGGVAVLHATEIGISSGSGTLSLIVTLKGVKQVFNKLLSASGQIQLVETLCFVEVPGEKKNDCQLYHIMLHNHPGFFYL